MNKGRFLLKLTGVIIIAVFTLTAALCAPKKSEAELAQEARIAELEAQLLALTADDAEEAAAEPEERETRQRQRRERAAALQAELQTAQAELQTISTQSASKPAAAGTSAAQASAAAGFPRTEMEARALAEKQTLQENIDMLEAMLQSSSGKAPTESEYYSMLAFFDAVVIEVEGFGNGTPQQKEKYRNIGSQFQTISSAYAAANAPPPSAAAQTPSTATATTPATTATTARRATTPAQAAFDARVAEGGFNIGQENNPADKIYQAVLFYPDKNSDPAQAAYDARVAEGGFDRNQPNNPADRIRQAVKAAVEAHAQLKAQLQAEYAQANSKYFPGVPASQIQTVIIANQEDWVGKIIGTRDNANWEPAFLSHGTGSSSFTKGLQLDKPYLLLVIDGDYEIGAHGSGASRQFPQFPAGATIAITGNGKIYMETYFYSRKTIIILDNDQTWIIDGNITLEGNTPLLSSGPVIAAGNRSKLELRNGTITGGSGGVELMSSGASFIMSGGAIRNSSRSGVSVDISSTFTMTGGTISGHTSGGGGGVVVSGTPTMSGTFIMSGGTISGNTASGEEGPDKDRGGGVLTSGTFTMTGGTISGNTAETGGGVYIAGGRFTKTGGTISGNTARGRDFGGNNAFVRSGYRPNPEESQYAFHYTYLNYTRDAAINAGDRLGFTASDTVKMPDNMPTAVGQTLNGWTRINGSTVLIER